jgi:hypothetical protein
MYKEIRCTSIHDIDFKYRICVKVSRTLMAFLCLSTNICKSPYLEYKKKQMSTILRLW